MNDNQNKLWICWLLTWRFLFEIQKSTLLILHQIAPAPRLPGLNKLYWNSFLSTITLSYPLFPKKVMCNLWVLSISIAVIIFFPLVKLTLPEDKVANLSIKTYLQWRPNRKRGSTYSSDLTKCQKQLQVKIQRLKDQQHWNLILPEGMIGGRVSCHRSLLRSWLSIDPSLI